MKRRISIASVAALVALVTVIGAAGAVRAPGAAGSHRIALTSVPAIKKFLRAHGISTAGLVVQRGKHNYAGASCPGAGWSCTEAKRVIQMAANDQNGQNTFECSPSNAPAPVGFPPSVPPFPTTTAAPTDCVIVQVNTTGNNSARCVIRSTLNPVTESCAISQQNATGNNDAFVEQVARQSGNPTNDDATQQVDVEQQSGAGSNSVQSRQLIDQTATQVGGSAAQYQFARLYLNINQTADSGKNSAHADQSDQLDEIARSVSGGFQLQFSDFEGHVTQNNVDVSAADVRQHEDLDQRAPDTVSQQQEGPMVCCANQQVNPTDHFNLDQSSSLSATSQFAFQELFIEGDCDSTGTCAVSQLGRVNGATGHNTCTGPSCHISTECFSGGGEAPTQNQPSNTGFCETFPGGLSFAGPKLLARVFSRPG